MKRDNDFTQRNPSTALLVAGSDSEELRDDIRNENSRHSDGIRRIHEGLKSDSGTTNRGYFSPTWDMEKGTETLDKQQEGDGSYQLRSIQLRINLQRATDESDPHQVRQHYRKALSRLNTQGDYSVKKEIFIALCQTWQITPIRNLFATGENKLVNRFVAIGEGEGEKEAE
ncbi:MAG: hypothetical protein EZS28_053875 [Streblomastix strix]|uniref:Uncharacterized protein n=1 Tax=Streblomastix strix TaxID=222440 RepID=A0A5J4R0U4_9EUKA|nr:MAG: hypothetical protein EZS28_053875 [Streblomastix strix]